MIEEFDNKIQALEKDFDLWVESETINTNVVKEGIVNKVTKAREELQVLEESSLQELLNLEKEFADLVQIKRQEKFDSISKLQAERDALVLAKKLEDFPTSLVESHENCSICGNEMRPFVIFKNDKKYKFWACQSGGLENAHDLVEVVEYA
jgi:hypothetical protein